MDPIAIYRELFEHDAERWRAGIPEFQRHLRERGNMYGTRDTVKVLRPKVLSTGDYAYYDYVCGVLTGLFRRLEPRVRAEPRLMDYMGLRPEERELIAYEPLSPDPAPFTRFDSFQTADGPRFVELNGECPAGPGFVDRSLECFEGHPLTKAYMERIGARTFSVKEGLYHGLMSVWRAAGKNGIPNVVVTDYLDLPTVGEFHMISEYLNSRGIKSCVEDPRALEYKGGRLYAQGRPIDLVYRRVLTNEFLDRRSELQAFEQAYRDRAIVVINPFRSKCIHKKAAFGLLCGDMIGQDWMTAEERRVVQRTIPWTRKFRESKTDFGDRSVDLVPFVVEHKDRFVLKPNDEYGGKGVVLGWTMDAAEFQKAAADALRHGDTVVQERVYTLQEPFPVMELGLEEVPMIVDLDPYVYLGRVHGVLARLAAGALCNVTSGGGQVPVVLTDSAC